MKENISKLDNKIASLVFIIPCIFPVAFFIYSIYTGPSTVELILRDTLAENVHGKVDSLYFDIKNHNVKYAVLKNNEKFSIFRNWERYIDVGDSLSKNKNSFLLMIYKKNKALMTLNYKDNYKKTK
ncbi:hypothetical protein [Pedobacter sp. MR2016-24]|uniref:hypothetical protein n=1 Tax=Pedobacter sp. MR2016-24 TaxID=2994466 RepID=UPI0022475372|nr:hypothetical protein [Pedobacter sp. MR2016-24]MCX2485697.1 hypothetical protein [Pedobacter sp. MR2016-24]